MSNVKRGRCGQIEPLDWLKSVPFEAAASSGPLGWVGMQAVRYRTAPASELNPPAMTHHRLILFSRPPEELDLLYEGVNRRMPPPAGSITMVPAGSPARYRWGGRMDTLNVYLEPGLVRRVAAEEFGLDSARLTIPPLDAMDLPHVRVAMGAVDAELGTGGPGGSLAAESLANILAVNLIRHILAPSRPTRNRDGVLPRARLRAVLDYVEGHLDGNAATLDQMATVARLSAYHFARQFKAATGLPPHQYVIMRRVERARHLLQAGTGNSVADVALKAGFSDQSQFSHHFKRLVGITPTKYRMSARTD
jgi:AraC family transcriptional regulator